jgi:hypothetical protein
MHCGHLAWNYLFRTITIFLGISIVCVSGSVILVVLAIRQKNEVLFYTSFFLVPVLAAIAYALIAWLYHVIHHAVRSQKMYYGTGVCPQCGEDLRDNSVEALPGAQAAILDVNGLVKAFGLTAPLRCPLCDRVSHLNCATAGYRSKHGNSRWIAICPACGYEICSVEIKHMCPQVFMYGLASDRDWPD